VVFPRNRPSPFHAEEPKSSRDETGNRTQAVAARNEKLPDNRYRQIKRRIMQNPYKSSLEQSGQMDGLAETGGPEYSPEIVSGFGVFDWRSPQVPKEAVFVTIEECSSAYCRINAKPVGFSVPGSLPADSGTGF
jgi:hypothetical protein